MGTHGAMNLFAYSTPQFFRSFTRVMLPLSGTLSVVLLVIGGYFALFSSPPDYIQGETVRIMYVHVPASWMALGVYSFVTLMGGAYLVLRNPLLGLMAKSAAPIGAYFTIMSLVTGALWGKPMWGAWWVWDARLTSMLILFFLYLGYIALVDSFDEINRGMQAGAWLTIVGFINIPIIKFSVDWWHTLHQPASIMKFAQPSIHPSMMLPLFLMAAAYICCFIWILLIRVNTELIQQRLRAQQIRMVMQNGG